MSRDLPPGWVLLEPSTPESHPRFEPRAYALSFHSVYLRHVVDFGTFRRLNIVDSVTEKSWELDVGDELFDLLHRIDIASRTWDDIVDSVIRRGERRWLDSDAKKPGLQVLEHRRRPLDTEPPEDESP